LCAMKKPGKIDSAMRLNPLYPFGLACVAFLLSFYALNQYVWFVGFPDGHITELGAAEQILATYFIRVSTVIGLWFVYLGISAFRAAVGKRTLYSCMLYLAVICVAIAIDRYLQSYLMDGAGG
jgi:hypothetical protein